MDKIVWVRGGIRRTTGHWDPAEGKTGFFRNRRVIEEPNPLSRFMREKFANGWACQIEGCQPDPSTYEELMDTLINMGDAHETIRVRFVRDGDQTHRLSLCPVGRMTPMETWIKDSGQDGPEDQDADA